MAMSGIVGLLLLTIGLKVVQKFIPQQQDVVQWLVGLEREQRSVQSQLQKMSGAIASQIETAPTATIAAQKTTSQTHQEQDVYTPVDWMPPLWLSSDEREDLWVLENLNDSPMNNKGPRIFSRSAFVVDIDSGEVLWEKNPDARRTVASLTKVLSSVALASLDLNLEEQTCLDVSMKPSLSGANTSFSAGDCVTGWDVLGAALVNSDNGAALGYAQVANLEYQLFVDQMNAVAEELRMTESSFVDPAGIGDENISTARDITRAAITAAVHNEVSIASSAKAWNIRFSEDKSKTLNTTNKLSWREVDWLVAKTGYTDTARACFTGVYEKNGRRIAVTTLGAWFSFRRWKDVNEIINWVDKH